MDPIANMITAIRNAQAVKKDTVKIPYSKINYNIALILKQEGFIQSVEKKEKKNAAPFMLVALKYTSLGAPLIQGFAKISKPGQRIYVKSNKIHHVKAGYGQSIISTSHGLLTGREASKKQLGGEHIANIW